MALTEIFPPYGEGFGVEEVYLTGSLSAAYLLWQTEGSRHFLCLPAEATASRDGLKGQAHPTLTNAVCFRVRLIRNSRTYAGLSHLIADYRIVPLEGTTVLTRYTVRDKLEMPAKDLDGQWVYGHDGAHNYYRPTDGDRQGGRVVAAGEFIIVKMYLWAGHEAADFESYQNCVNSSTFHGFSSGTLLFLGTDINQDLRNFATIHTYRFAHDARGWNNLVKVTQGKKVQEDTGNGPVISWDSEGYAQASRRMHESKSFSSIPGL